MTISRMDPMELAMGWIHGFDDVPMPPDPGIGPRAALEQSLAECLERPHCMVAFSGGRDSSALLAVATHVARREGLRLPIPLILRYTNAPGSEELDWQQRVLEHLRLEDPLVVQVGDEHDAIGPMAAPLLRRYGSVWPPNFVPTWRLMDSAKGGVLITGEAGDEVLGSRRIMPAVNTLRLLRARSVPPRRFVRASMHALAPKPIRRQVAIRQMFVPPWLRPDVASMFADREVADQLAFSLHAGRQTHQFVRRSAVRRAFETLQVFAEDAGVEHRTPFMDDAFLGALAHAQGRWGWSGRAATMVRLFTDVLPASVLTRRTKAYFNRAICTEYTKEFARKWDGHSGVDTTLVDPEALRENWLSAMPHLLSMGLLQSAWLANQPATQVQA